VLTLPAVPVGPLSDYTFRGDGGGKTTDGSEEGTLVRHVLTGDLGQVIMHGQQGVNEREVAGLWSYCRSAAATISSVKPPPTVASQLRQRRPIPWGDDHNPPVPAVDR
jgi:hypothetical protein